MGLVDQLRAELFGRGERAWAGSVEELLFEGESVRRTVPLDGNRVVVTSHRLLAFTPGGDGGNYRQVDLPNVADVRAGHDGEENLLTQAVRQFLYGGILLAVGLFFDFETIVPTEVFSGTGTGASRLGLGGVIATMQSLLDLIAILDDIARLVGAALVVLGAVVVVVYLLTRDRVLVVAVAGDDPDITVPAGDDAADDAIENAVATLEAVLFESGSGAAPARDGPGSGAGSEPGSGTDDASGSGRRTSSDAAQAGESAGNADAGFNSDEPL